MKNDKSKRNDLIDAILSRDREKLKKALQQGKPEKWVCIQMDHEKKELKVENKLMTKEDVRTMIAALEKDFCVKLILMEYNRQEDGSRDEYWTFLDSPEYHFVFRKVTLKL